VNTATFSIVDTNAALRPGDLRQRFAGEQTPTASLKFHRICDGQT
jgi:hypothetical protein